METIRLLGAVVFGLILPQVLGWLGYRWSRQKGMLVRLATLFIAPVVFFISAQIFWGLSAQAIRETGHYVCGAFGAAAVFSTIAGTMINLIMGIILFLVVSFIWKRKAAPTQP